jgi:hypothetical protein
VGYAGSTGSYAWSAPARAYDAAQNADSWGLHAITEKVVAGTPGAPGSVTAARGTGSLDVTWAPAPSSGTAIDMYGVFAFDATGYADIAATACPAEQSGRRRGTHLILRP